MRLKNNLRDVLNRQPEFALWKLGTETLGGLAAWKGMNTPGIHTCQSPPSPNKLTPEKS